MATNRNKRPTVLVVDVDRSRGAATARHVNWILGRSVVLADSFGVGAELARTAEPPFDAIVITDDIPASGDIVGMANVLGEQKIPSGLVGIAARLQDRTSVAQALSQKGLVGTFEVIDAGPDPDDLVDAIGRVAVRTS